MRSLVMLMSVLALAGCGQSNETVEAEPQVQRYVVQYESNFGASLMTDTETGKTWLLVPNSGRMSLDGYSGPTINGQPVIWAEIEGGPNRY